MPSTSRRKPKLRHHKHKGLAYVELNGRRLYLGRWGTAESRDRFKRTLAEWETAGRRTPVQAERITVAALAEAFGRHADEYYRGRDGGETAERGHYREVLTLAIDLYGPTPAAEFGPIRFKTVRARMVEKGWCRKHVNAQAGRLRRVFRWAVGEELILPGVVQALDAVEGLRRGRSGARESLRVVQVPIEHIEAVRRVTSRQVRALIDLQLLTGARPGELTIMRPIDLDMSGAVWTFRPMFHKTECHEHERLIYLGPRAQDVVRPFLSDRAVDAFMFSPHEAETERRAAMRAARKTPLSCGNSTGTNCKTKPRRRPGDRYDTAGYRHAIQYACRKAGVPEFHPHRLRHNAATELRRQFGLDVAKTVLGHTSPTITALYAEQDHRKAVEVISKIG